MVSAGHELDWPCFGLVIDLPRAVLLITWPGLPTGWSGCAQLTLDMDGHGKGLP
jgi:hypothetical protein